MAVRSSAFKMTRTGSSLNLRTNPRIDLSTLITNNIGYTFDCSTKSTFTQVGSATTFNINNMGEGQYVTLVLASTGGAYSITWAANNGTIKWASSAVPVPTITIGKYDMYSFLKIGSNIFATAALNCG